MKLIDFKAKLIKLGYNLTKEKLMWVPIVAIAALVWFYGNQ